MDLADKFREELGIFYSRQEGVFQNLSDEEKKQLGITDDRDMRIRPLAQTFLAVQGDVYNMGHLPDVFESQQLYEKAFKYAYNNADAKSIVMGYKVGLMISRIIGRLKEIVPAKYYESCPKARNIVWALLIQALLNEKKCTQCRELYGGSMQLEFAFGDLLKQLAAIRVWPLLKDVINSPSYKDKIEQNKYDFLRTADAFKKAMNLAADKFGWQKRTFV